MGKNKRSRSKGRDYDNILRELKKITSKSKKRRRSWSSSSSETERSLKRKRYYDYGTYPNEFNDEDYTMDYQGEHSPVNYQDPEIVSPELVEAGPLSSTQSVGPAATGSAEAPAAADTAAPPTSDVLYNQPTANPVAVTTEIPDDETVPSLEPEILELLGENPADTKKYGENLHKDTAPRWMHILKNGLTKETQLELVKSYLPPENCPNIKVPILNLEIKAALLESSVKKDLYSQSKQNQLASSLAAIGQVLNWALSSKDVVPQNIIKTLSDAGRLMCDSHYRESLSRRFAALATLNKNIKDTIRNTTIDEHLFGSALSEHIKSSKAIIKTSSEIKSTAARPMYRPPAATQRQQRGALNLRGAPPRAPAGEPRQRPAPRRPPPPPPRERRELPRGRRTTAYTRHPGKRRY